MAKFTEETIQKMLNENLDTKDIHKKYLVSTLKLPVKPTERMSSNDSVCERVINKLKNNGFQEISGEMLDKYLRVYAQYSRLYAGQVLYKEGHNLWVNISEPRYWNDFYISLIDINNSENIFIIDANTAEQAIYAVDKYEEAEELWKKKWSIEEAKMRKLMDINQNTLEIMLKNVVKKHNWEYTIEKDSSKRTTLSIRLSGRQQVSMKFKKSVSSDVIINVANIISQFVDIIKTNKDIDISVRGVSFKTKWIKPETSPSKDE